MACSCEKHDHRGPLDESTENCVVDGCECGEAPEGYVVPNTDPEKGEVPAAGYLTREEPAEEAAEPATTAVSGATTTVTPEPVAATVATGTVEPAAPLAAEPAEEAKPTP